jgi:hypothetical protein
MEIPTYILFIPEAHIAKRSLFRGRSRSITGVRRRSSLATKLHALIANQIAIAISATTIAHHIAGVVCFELPLRGESLAAWSNS